ncbi:hypothetical protein GCM10023088_49450 [Actinomadura verrucosospora]|uniref:transposase n=1 Tax=Actinomadura verrucosospora TaxID=46165 RepID=UPI00336F4DD6
MSTGCPLREQCTNAKTGRILTIRPHHDLQAAARRQAAGDPDWQADYRRWRPPVERAVAWLVHHGNRRLRHRGTINADAWLHTRAAAPTSAASSTSDSPEPTTPGTCPRPKPDHRGLSSPRRTAPLTRSSAVF